MIIIHITTDGMDAHTYRYENIDTEWGPSKSVPGPSYESLTKLEQSAVQSLATDFDTRPLEPSGDEREASWQARALSVRLALAKYHFAKGQGLIKAAREHLYPKGMKYRPGHRAVKGLNNALKTLGEGGEKRAYLRRLEPVTGLLLSSAIGSLQDLAQGAVMEEDIRASRIARHACSQFEYTLLSLDEARSRYHEHEELTEGLYVPHPSHANKLIPLKDFPTRTLRERLFDLLRLLAQMGASKIVLAETEDDQYWGQVEAKAGGLLDASLGGSYQRRSATEAEVHLEGGGELLPSADLLHRSTWFRNDDQLRFLLGQRRAENRVTYFRYKLETELHVDINLELAAKVKGVNANALAAYEGFRNRSLTLEVTF